jgi:hypothetical protein
LCRRSRSCARRWRTSSISSSICVDALPDLAAIGLELRLAGAPRADAAAEPRQRGPGADEARQQVLELRQLHLPLALARARPPREDVEDELRAIDDLALEPLSSCAAARGSARCRRPRRRCPPRRTPPPAPRPCPLPRNVAGSGAGVPAHAQHDAAPAAAASPASSSSDCSAANRRVLPVMSPTMAARSADAVRVE